MNNLEGHSRSSELPLFERPYTYYWWSVYSNNDAILGHIRHTTTLLIYYLQCTRLFVTLKCPSFFGQYGWNYYY